MNPRCASLLSLAVLASGMLLPQTARSQGSGGDGLDFGGHGKYQYVHNWLPSDSILRLVGGERLVDHNFEARFKFSASRGSWDVRAHAQFIALRSDTLPGFAGLPGKVIDDDRRWFNLTHEISHSGRTATLVRLDRANVAYTGEKSVWRFGRQAISWGNGLMFTPLDIFNPFDPAAVDREYKTGDDMLYGQYLFDSGADIQLVAVARRDLLSGELERDQSSLALKFHGFRGSFEYDWLLAEHYGERMAGFGISTDFGGAVWRGDLSWSDTPSGGVFSGVAGASYSGVTGGYNWSGFVEYFYNGFGQKHGDYAAALRANPALSRRLAKGELFTLARHYLGVSVMVELTPLLHLTPNLFVNLDDPSALSQWVVSYDWKQDIQLLGAFSFPLGPRGSEYGGIASDEPGLYLSTGPALFAQLAWYF